MTEDYVSFIQCTKQAKMNNRVLKQTYITAKTIFYFKRWAWAFAATWMQLEIIILSEVTQKEKDKYHMISLTCGI